MTVFTERMCFPFLQMAGVFSQLELSMIRERVRSGMANAKAKGKQIGRPQTTKDSIPAIFLRHYPAFKNGQLKIAELARVCDLSRTTVYKYIGLLEKHKFSSALLPFCTGLCYNQFNKSNFVRED